MWNIKGFGSREQYDVEGLGQRIERLGKDTASATGITAKRLRLLASLDRLKGFSDADYSKNNSELKAAGISSKFVRNCILKGGLKDQDRVADELVQPLSKAVTNKITSASVNEKKFNTKYLSVLDNLHAKLPPAMDSAERHLPAVDSVISGRTASLNKKNEASEKASIATVYSSHKDGFAKDLAEVGRLTLQGVQSSSEAPPDLKPTVDALVNHLIALPKDKNGNRLKDILSILKNAASQAQSDSSESIPASIKDLRPHLFNENGTGVSLYKVLLPESENELPPQVQQIFKALRQKYITPHNDNELNQLITGNRAFINAHKAQVPPLGAAWQDFFPQYAASAGGLDTIEKLVSIAESARGDTQNTMIAQLVNNDADLPSGLKHAYAALSLGMHQNIANDSGLRLLRNESIAQGDLGGLKELAEAPVNRSSYAGSTPGRHSDAGQPADPHEQQLASGIGASPPPSARSSASAVVSEVAPVTLETQRQAWLDALRIPVDSNSSNLILSVPPKVGAEPTGGTGEGGAVASRAPSNSAVSVPFQISSKSEDFVEFLWGQVPEELKVGADGNSFKDDFKKAAEQLHVKLFLQTSFHRDPDLSYRRPQNSSSELSWEAEILPDSIIIKKKE